MFKKENSGNKTCLSYGLVHLWQALVFSLVMPFMSLYIDTLVSYTASTASQLNFWSGITFFATFLITTLISPWWGKSADQKSRNLMLLRASPSVLVLLKLLIHSSEHARNS